MHTSVLYFCKKTIDFIIFVYCCLYSDTFIAVLNLMHFSSMVIISLVAVIIVLISVAFLTLLERKKLAYVQNRKRPNKVGFLGILQPISDGVKLLSKETIFPQNSLLCLFFISPVLAFSFGFRL